MTPPDLYIVLFSLPGLAATAYAGICMLVGAVHRVRAGTWPLTSDQHEIVYLTEKVKLLQETLSKYESFSTSVGLLKAEADNRYQEHETVLTTLVKSVTELRRN